MGKVLIVLVVVGICGAYLVFAHDDFDVHDVVQPEARTEKVVVPNQEGTDSVLLEQYEKALEQAQERGDYGMVQELIDREEESEPVTKSNEEVVAKPNASELPFELLDKNIDADQDGLSNADEVRIGSKTQVPDSDGDGYIDGLEVVRGYNPLVASPGDKIEYKKPLGATNAEYRITGIRLGVSGANETLTVTGTGPASSLIVLLGYSTEDLFWVSRTDKTGRFMYVSADTLDPGEYTFYAASISANGVSIDVSKPLMFERTADALIKKVEPTEEPEINDENEGNSNLFWYAAIPIGAGALLAVVIFLSWIVSKKKKGRISN